MASRPESAGEAVATALGLELGSPTLYLERLRVAGGEPLLLEQVHLPAERFPGLLASDLEHGSLYDLLPSAMASRVAKAREFMEPVLLRAREARLLGRKPGSPALLIEGIASTADGTPVEFGRTFVRGDRTRYYVERVVVRPHWEGAATTKRRSNRMPSPSPGHPVDGHGGTTCRSKVGRFGRPVRDHAR